MKDYSYVFNAHPAYIESLYKNYQQDPTSVDEGWRVFFDGFEFNTNGADASFNGSDVSGGLSHKELNVLSLINGYRSRAHLLSKTNPLKPRKDRKPHLSLADYDLSDADLHQRFNAGETIGLKNATLAEIISKLQKIYCGHIGFEYVHIEDQEKREWLRNRIENQPTDDSYGLSKEKKIRILDRLNDAVIFEKFLHTKYIGQKRFSLEGGETTIAALDAIINKGAEDKVEEVIMGMAHRGRLNVLANIMGKTYDQIFNEFEGTAILDQSFGDGDVKYHLGFSSQIHAPSGKLMHLKLVPNPSHLEAVDPVLEGFSRAKADVLYLSDYDRILPVLIHGDSAVAGQGVVYETTQMSQLEGYYTGGSIHFVTNNQIGFTTDYDDARSSTYCTAAGYLVQAPIFHVNGDDPEAVVFVSELALEYRQQFNCDVFIDMVCYRRHGHNEGDDPKFTQPTMYNLIEKHKDPREIYLAKLIERGDVTAEIGQQLEDQFWAKLQERLDMVKQHELPYKYQEPEQQWRSLTKTLDVNKMTTPNTGVERKQIDFILKHLMTIPEGFTPNSKVKRLQKGKQTLLDQGKVDWAFGELLSYGTLLLDGKNVRMSGQDVQRGTFSHRHAVFFDEKTNAPYNRLDHMTDKSGRFMIYNSLLSEYAVLGFEYGYSLASPDHLAIWEAQFGDFYNGAQIVVDQFISAGESKWQRMSGLVVLLPHGLEGQGPEHSSGRLERFLQLCGDFNMIVCNVTTPANYFHMIRRQLAMPYRKPLIHMSPKSLLRHPECVSDITDMVGKTKFLEVIPDTEVKKAKRVLFCSGKIYYDLLDFRRNNEIKDVAIVRVEQLYPLPEKEIRDIIKQYGKAELYWVQEEPENMGAWNYLMNYFRRDPLELISRKSSASPSTGFKKIHDEQQLQIMKEAFNVK
ncbi:MAG: 2-oxoglutarate dehydrogenase E1 component [Saprospiraceae bacterium]|nr:MAG: 2-oxoglutarate dehydrogenase E1 [Bacteroidetes bacterium OLB9]MCO6462716.1 2-oxoglutarate dehydrogenase E1 component [Saprospiraceae bacterium]MCZ2340023.1 2-oxoglutarate dehydrogenase E1 component [Chitinophagales bacterium]